MDDKVRAAVQTATVCLPKLGGQAVLVHGGVLLTAAHCIKWSGEGGMVLEDFFIEEIRTSDGRTLRVRPVAVEPVSDIAVLGALDDQTFPKEATELEEYLLAASPLRISVAEPQELFTPSPSFVLAHTGDWIEGSVQLAQEGAEILWFESTRSIEGGTSGGPVVDADGNLIGIVSNAATGATGDGCDGTVPRPHLALPVWIWRDISEAQEEA